MIDTEKHCVDCYNDIYNHQNFGANMKDGVPRCWSAETATLVKALDVHVDAMPPYKHLTPTERPSCYKRQRFVRVKPENLDAKGYWKC